MRSFPTVTLQYTQTRLKSRISYSIRKIASLCTAPELCGVELRHPAAADLVLQLERFPSRDCNTCRPSSVLSHYSLHIFLHALNTLEIRGINNLASFTKNELCLEAVERSFGRPAATLPKRKHGANGRQSTHGCRPFASGYGTKVGLLSSISPHTSQMRAWDIDRGGLAQERGRH